MEHLAQELDRHAKDADEIAGCHRAHRFEHGEILAFGPCLRDTRDQELGQADGIVLLSAYQNCEDAVIGLSASQPDVVLMDINLPKASGIRSSPPNRPPARGMT